MRMDRLTIKSQEAFEALIGLWISSLHTPAVSPRTDRPATPFLRHRRQCVERMGLHCVK